MLRVCRFLLKLIIVLSLIGFLCAAGIYFFLSPKLPDTKTLKETQLQIPLRIYSAEGELMAEFGEKRRVPVTYEEIPDKMIKAFLAAEDDRFYSHPGVDYQGILRAAYSLLVTGEKSQGGSTITMQVARNFYLTNEKTYLRKLNEIILALEIEQVLTKEEILTLYLNKIYLGNRAYGIGAAATTYYGRPLSELTLSEMAMIAGLPKAPSRYNPVANAERAKIRRNYVLGRMRDVGFINETEYSDAIQAPVTAEYHGSEIDVYAPYVAEMIRTELYKEYDEELYTHGLNVYTTIRADHQKAANHALQNSLLDYDRRHGYRGPIAQVKLPENATEENFEEQLDVHAGIGPLKPAIVTQLTNDEATIYVKKEGVAKIALSSVKWAGKKLSTNSRGPAPKKMADLMQVGDIIRVEKQTAENWKLAQLPEAQGALVAVSPDDGAVTALNGGFEFFNSKFNRATQSRRQPGSGFKPFIYSAALERGYTAATIINDAPVVYDDPGLENVWRPENYSGKFFGPTRLREALIHSRNLVSIRLLRDIGADYAVDYAKRFGFDDSMLHKNLSLALGSGNAAPLDMARAYAVIANGGFRVEPYVIQRIEDSHGKVLHEAAPMKACRTCDTEYTDDLEMIGEAPNSEDLAQMNEDETSTTAERVMTPQNNYIMNSLLRDVVRFGTGRQAMSLGRNDLAGKTGTTNDQLDAWFNGFQPNLVATAWVGFDRPQTLGRYETGGRAALPMWIDFMKVALKDQPQVELTMPPGMVTVRVDKDTGLLASPGDPNSTYESFREENVPTETASTVDGGSTPVIELF